MLKTQKNKVCIKKKNVMRQYVKFGLNFGKKLYMHIACMWWNDLQFIPPYILDF